MYAPERGGGDHPSPIDLGLWDSPQISDGRNYHGD